MIIQAELKCKQTGCEADPCAVAVWILRNTVRTAWEMTARQKQSSACCAAWSHPSRSSGRDRG